MENHFKYWPPPCGIRTKLTLENGDFTRRNPETGPYGIFIFANGSSERCQPNERNDYMLWWKRATIQMKKCLWGSRRERESAKTIIHDLNKNIRAYNALENREVECGVIDEVDWSNAGKQLDLAIRDICLYNSTARFEDVRDFIWERIQNRLYPEYWEVKWSDLNREIENRRDNFSNIQRGNGLDEEDGAYRFRQETTVQALRAVSNRRVTRQTTALRRSSRRRPRFRLEEPDTDWATLR